MLCRFLFYHYSMTWFFSLSHACYKTHPILYIRYCRSLDMGLIRQQFFFLNICKHDLILNPFLKPHDRSDSDHFQSQWLTLSRAVYNISVSISLQVDARRRRRVGGKASIETVLEQTRLIF